MNTRAPLFNYSWWGGRAQKTNANQQVKALCAKFYSGNAKCMQNFQNYLELSGKLLNADGIMKFSELYEIEYFVGLNNDENAVNLW